MLIKENLIAIDCKHVLRAVKIKFNDQLMTKVKRIRRFLTRYLKSIYDYYDMSLLNNYDTNYRLFV